MSEKKINAGEDAWKMFGRSMEDPWLTVVLAPCRGPKLCPDPPPVHLLHACDIQDGDPAELVHQTGTSPAGPEDFGKTGETW